MYMGTGIGVAVGLPYFPGAAGGAGGGGMLDSELNGLSFKASNDFMEIKDTTTSANNYRGSASTKFGNSRASQALRYNSDDILVWSPENILTFSEDMTGADWIAGGAVVTPNAIAAPDGTMTADLVADTNPAALSLLYRMPAWELNVRYTVSIHVKAGTSNKFVMGGNGDVMSPFWGFDLTGAGSIQSLGSGLDLGSATIFAMANGWYRCSVSFTFLGGAMFLIFAPAFGSTAAGDATLTGNMYFWGAQLERSSTAGKYIPTTSSPGYGIRLDYDARLGVNKPGYLTEKEKTNYILSSRNLADAAVWNASGTIVANQAVSAMGDTTLAKWTTVGLSDDRLMQTNASAANATGKVWIISFWAKCETGTFNLPVLVDSADSVVFINTAVPLTTTLKRFYVVGTAGTIATTALRVLFGGFNSMTASPSAVLYIGDVQAEMSDTGYPGITGPSSYIPTTTATVTRAGDTPHVPTTQFPYASQTSTLYVKWFEVANRGGNALLLNNKEFDYGNYMGLTAGGSYPPYGGITVSAYMASGLINNYQIANQPQGVAYKAALGWAPNNLNMAFKGLIYGADDTNDPTYPVLNELAIGYGVIYLNQLDGWILEGMYLPRRMTNSQLQVQTGGDPILSAADTLLGSATNGVAIAASDDSMTIKDTTNPAHNYQGSAVERFGTSVRASAGSYYNSTGVLALLATGELRRDYSPFAAGSKFLVETQRTNVAPWSSAPDGHWSIYVGTGTWGAIAVPDGTTVNALLTLTAGPASIFNGSSFPSSGVPWTASVYAKAGTITSFQLGINFNFAGAIFDLTTGTVTPANGHTGRMYSVGNGWWRCEAYVTTANPTNSIVIQTVGGAGTIAFWGWQAEAGLTASSYIPTTTASVTRAADYPQLPTSQFPFSSTAGTMYAKYIQGSNDNTYPMSINITGNYSEYINLMAGGGYPPYGGYNFSIWTSEGNQTNQERPGYPPGPPYKVAGAWAIDSANSAFQGLIWGADDTTITLNSAYNTLSIGHASYGAGNLNGWMLEALYLPTRMSNAELVTRTT